MQDGLVNGFDFSTLPIEIRLAGERTTDGWRHDLWIVTIGQGAGEWTTEYKTGTGHRSKSRHQWDQPRPVKPSKASIVHSLMLDAEALCQSFTDWCDNYGYSNDSLQAFDTYRLCCSIGEKMRKTFSHSRLNAMREALIDY